MGLFDLFKKKQPQPAPVEKSKNTLTVRVTGTNHRDQKEIASLGKYNPEYELGKRELVKKYPDGVDIYEYTFPNYSASFEFEPTNEYDPNAIKVLIKGIHVGYVKKGSCSRIRNLINQNKIKSISAKIYGGNSKSLYLPGIIEGEKPSSSDYEFGKGGFDFRVDLTLELTE